MTQIATTIDQGKYLLKCGVVKENADMHWQFIRNISEPGRAWHDPVLIPARMPGVEYPNMKSFPAWSLSALIALLPKKYGPSISFSISLNEWIVEFDFLKLHNERLNHRECDSNIMMALIKMVRWCYSNSICNGKG